MENKQTNKQTKNVGLERVQNVVVFFRRRKESYHIAGQKAGKAREPTVESLTRGIWRLRVSEVERKVREGVQIEDREAASRTQSNSIELTKNKQTNTHNSFSSVLCVT